MKFFAWRFYKLKKAIKKINLIDRFLIIFMIILMSQSIYNLFAKNADSDLTNSIDIIVRTTSASIFGYFLSVNFIKKAGSTTEKTNTLAQHSPAPYAAEAEANSRAVTSEIEEIKNLDLNLNNNKESEGLNQQIIITSVIGIIALIVLIIARNFINTTPKTIGTLTQMRDFVSACVGFLIGYPNDENDL